jgi:hypothetical protein
MGDTTYLPFLCKSFYFFSIYRDGHAKKGIKHMIYLGKLLKVDDIHIFFYADSQVESGNRDVLGAVTGTLNSPEFTLSTFESTYSQSLTLVDPYYVSYTIFDNTQGKKEIIRQTINSIPMRYDTGIYYVPLKLHPKIFRVGSHIIEWSFRRFADNSLGMTSDSAIARNASSLRTMTDEFMITRNAAYSGEFCQTSSTSIQSTNKCKCSVHF